MSDMLSVYHREGPLREPGFEQNHRLSNPEYKPPQGSFDQVAQSFIVQLGQVLQTGDSKQLQQIDLNKQLLDCVISLLPVLLTNPGSSSENQADQVLTSAIDDRQNILTENSLLLELDEGDPDLNLKLNQEIDAIKLLYIFSNNNSLIETLESIK